MRTVKLFDPKLSIKEYSYEIGKLLKRINLNEIPGADTEEIGYLLPQTFAWYNGRERGIGIMLTTFNSARPTYVIAFGEHRTSDSIFIDHWTMDRVDINPPTVADFPDYAYDNTRLYISYSDDMFQKAAKVITALVMLWVKGAIKPGFGQRDVDFNIQAENLLLLKTTAQKRLPAA
jgi:hypothetical protein